MHAEEQEELSSRERAQLRDELTALRTHNNDLMTKLTKYKVKQIVAAMESHQKRCKRKISSEKPVVRPKPAFLKIGTGPNAWSQRLRLALAADLLRGRCRSVDNAISEIHTHLATNNKALQEACTLLEDQLTESEKLTDLHEVKNKDLESETQRMRSELEACRARLEGAERAAAERATAAGLAAQRATRPGTPTHNCSCYGYVLNTPLTVAF
ncbi:hypothetical protein RR48_05038 [Papilio machaon]|uniref:Uncharacterized protein n=1 Tax=Papilio machaon TaxID=76193 RepID=A0A0N1INK4_PAPMA|nr:hypothetical protein RR48_05038 [Papilio machaon]